METNRLFEQSDTWTEEDCLDVTTFSLEYAATIVHSEPEILGGNLVSIGTRVPMKTLLDCLEAGDIMSDRLTIISRPGGFLRLEIVGRYCW